VQSDSKVSRSTTTSEAPGKAQSPPHPEAMIPRNQFNPVIQDHLPRTSEGLSVVHGKQAR